MSFLRLVILSLFLTTMAYCSQKDDAINNAKEAFLIQSGTYEYAGKAGKYIVTELHAEVPMATGLFVYKTVRSKSVSFPYRDKKITLTPNQVQISFPF